MSMLESPMVILYRLKLLLLLLPMREEALDVATFC